MPARLLLSLLQEQQIRNLYIAGESIECVSMTTGFGRKLVHSRLTEWGLTRTQSEASRKAPCNELAFSVLSEQALYWAGFIMADGCVSPFENRSTRIAVALHRTDREHLEKLAAFVGMPRQSVYDYRKREVSKLTIASTRMAADLLGFGITPAKSKTAAVARDNPLILHSVDFWRGMFDGDGCLRWQKRHSPSITLTTGSVEIFRQLELFLRHRGLPTGYYRIPGKNYRLYGVRARRLIKCLYEDCVIALDRKFAIAMEILHDGYAW